MSTFATLDILAEHDKKAVDVAETNFAIQDA